MAKQLNVNMSFTADTSQAKAQIADLQHSLQNLSTSTLINTSSSGFSKSITEATAKVAELRANLEAAVNTDTGQLDLSKFSQQLKQSNTTLGQYKTQLMALGPEGTKAFSQLASAVVQAEMPLKQTNALMSQLWTTLQNTVRWQLTSSLIHGIMRTVSQAFGYVKNLNGALNDIRIRTGASTEQMAAFAQYANQAAKDLSTTTLDMAKASLIYYQQGLSDDEAKKRAEITVKMANVTRDSAQEVSQQLTAVWNNFAEGGENLEYYADVMNALGAATASSTDEIATGLEKFAAVAKTAGLSYEYAASALATIAATTRQSAETVGTGLRTVLARIESLKLGDTLEDGVDLTKYTSALQTIGVEVLDINGSLKSADEILNDMAASWQNLTAEQKMATAETVGGIRQYATIMALMENWDFMKKNIDVARSSEGTLQKQADIYAESWEAAANRVQASVQGIYQQLLDDQFFTKALDGFAKFLDIIKQTIDGIGGLKSLLLIISTIITTKLQTQMAESFQRIGHNFMMMTNAGRQHLQELRQDAVNALTGDVFKGEDVFNKSMRGAYTSQAELSQEYLANADKMNAVQRSTAQIMMDQQKTLIDNVELTAKEAREAERHNNAVAISFNKTARASGMNNSEINGLQEQATVMGQAEFAMNSAINLLGDGGSYEQVLQIFEELKISGKDLASVYGTEVSEAFQTFESAVRNGASVEETQEAFEQLDSILLDSEDYVDQLADSFVELSMIKIDNLTNSLEYLKENNPFGTFDADIARIEKEIQGYEKGIETLTGKTREYIQAAKDKANAESINQESIKTLNKLTDNYKVKMSQLATQNYTLSQSFAALARSASAIGMTISMVSNAIKTLTSPDTSALEKLTTILTTLGFVIPSVMRLISTENLAMVGSIGLKIQGLTAEEFAYEKLVLSMGKKLAVETELSVADAHQAASAVGKVAAYIAETEGIEAVTAASLKELIVKALDDAELAKRIGLTPAMIAALKSEEISIDELTIGWIKETAAKKASAAASLTALGPFAAIAAVIALIVASLVLFNKHLHASQKEFESITKTTDASNNSIKELNSQYKNLNNTFDSLKEKTDALQEIQYGTLQWKESVAEINDEVEQLIQQYGLVEGKDFFRNSLGALELTTAGQLEIETKAANIYAQSAVVEASNQIAAQTAGVAASKENIRNELNSFLGSEFLGGLSGAYASSTQMQGAYYLGQYLGEDTTAPGYVENLAADLANVWSDHDFDLIEQLIEKGQLTLDNYDKSEGYVGLDTEKLEALLDNPKALDSIQSLIIAIQANTEAQQRSLENSIMANEEARNALYGTHEDEYGNQVANVPEEYRSGILSVMAEDIQSDAKQMVANGQITQEQVDANRTEYYQASGFKNVNGKWQTSDGTEIEDEKYDTQIKEWLAVSEAQEKAIKNIDDYTARIEKSQKVWDRGKTLIKNLENQKDAIQECKEAQEEYSRAVEEHGKDSRRAIDALNKQNKAFEQNAGAIQELRDFTVDMFKSLGMTEEAAQALSENLDDAFIVENADLIQKAANNDIDALNDLRAACAEEILLDLDIQDDAVREKVNGLHTWLSDWAANNNYTTTASIDDSEFINACNEIISAAGMTADQASEYFKALGYDAEFIMVPKIVPGSSKTTTTTGTVYNPVTKKNDSVFSRLTEIISPQTIMVPTIKSITYNGSNGGIVRQSGGGGGGGGSSAPSSGGGGGGGGGGGSAPKQAKTQKVEPKEPERYKEITDTIEDLTQALEKTNTESDRLWGKNRLSSMQKANDILKKQADAYKEKARQARNFLDIDRAALQKTLTATWTGEYEGDNGLERIRESFGNLNFTFDADGDISNYTEIMTKITDMYNARQAYWADASHFADADAQSRYEDLYVKPMEEQISLIEEAISKYEETKGVWEENEEAAKKAIREWQDNNFEQLELKLELKLQVDENELKKIEYYIEKLSDDFYQMGENVANYEKKVANTQQHLTDLNKSIQELTVAYINGEISEKDYYEKMQDIHDETYDYLTNLKELDKELSHYFGETIDAGQEELDKYIDRLNHINDALEHYKEVITLINGTKNYNVIGQFLNGIASNTMNTYLTSQSNYNMLTKRREEVEQKLLAATDENQRKFIQQELDDIITAQNEAQITMLENAQAAAEAYKAVWENSLEAIAYDFEMFMTNDMGWDLLNDSLDRLSARQDEYLTKTNQLYEMNDLLRKLQDDSNKTTNVAAKQRIANFSREMEQLKNKNELSKLDLDIAKARYQQMLAEIALEEAQNAKSMVRLRRDSEGNYGYMYTADQDKIRQAEDDLAKANNDLYNIALNATNDYTQKALQLEQEHQDKMIELIKKADEEGWLETERFEQERTRLEEEYHNLRKSYLNEYNTAIYWLNETAATDQTEAWTQSYKTLMDKSSEWETATTEAIDRVYKATVEYRKNLTPILEGPDSLTNAIGNPTEAISEWGTESQVLLDYLRGEDGLINTIGNELQQVLDETNKYLQNQQKEVYNTMIAYEGLNDKIADNIALQAGMAGEFSDDDLYKILKTSKDIDISTMNSPKYDSGKEAYEAYLQDKMQQVLYNKNLIEQLVAEQRLAQLNEYLDSINSGIISAPIMATGLAQGGGIAQTSQAITINADFPNATDQYEIQAAFDSLINRASQYAGRF